MPLWLDRYINIVIHHKPGYSHPSFSLLGFNQRGRLGDSGHMESRTGATQAAPNYNKLADNRTEMTQLRRKRWNQAR